MAVKRKKAISMQVYHTQFAAVSCPVPLLGCFVAPSARRNILGLLDEMIALCECGWEFIQAAAHTPSLLRCVLAWGHSERACSKQFRNMFPMINLGEG